MKKISLLISLLMLSTYGQLLPLRVSSNGRFLVQIKENAEQPFFLLGDTDWGLLKLSKTEMTEYLKTRSDQGFNCILGPVMFNTEKDLFKANNEGEFPFTDPKQLNTLNNKYLEIFDFVIAEAEKYHIYVGLVPMWSDLIKKYDGQDLIPFGTVLGERFSKYNNVFWIVGGEAAGETPTDKVEALAIGLENGHLGKQLMTVHPTGNRSSSMGNNWLNSGLLTYTYHNSPWLDFNTLQSGHHKNHPTFQLITRDYNLTPTKPVIEGEYFYENHPEWSYRNDPNAYRATDYDVRKGGYWSVFAGGAGFVYGHHAVWQFYTFGKKTNISAPTVDWKTALKSPGAEQMKYLAYLMRTRPYLSRIPDPNIVSIKNDSIPVFALRDGEIYKKNASYIMAYFTDSTSSEIRTDIIPGKSINITWFNPKTGNGAMHLKKEKNNKVFYATPPARNDWVLIIDDASKGFPLVNYQKK